MSRFINPYTDFGFKKLFGEEANNDLLIDFLNQLLPPHHQIQSLQFENTEKMPLYPNDRKAFFDIHCINAEGEQFIVEMQRAPMEYFKDRALFYVTFPIQSQAKKGIWNFELQTIYFIAILDFITDKTENMQQFRQDICLKNQDGNVFYDKLHFCFLQMPLFNKAEHELQTKFEKWIYFLKNLATLQDIPKILNEPLFKKAFQIAELVNLKPTQAKEYQKSLLDYFSNRAVLETARKEGFEEGKQEGFEEGKQEGFEEGKIKSKLEIAAELKKEGMSIDKIIKITGLSAAECKKL